jgi:hypothetical protein
LGLVIVGPLWPGGRIGVAWLTLAEALALSLARRVRCMTGGLASVSIGSALTAARLSATAACGSGGLTRAG